MRKISTLLFLSYCSLQATSNISYMKNDIHAFLPKNNEVNVQLEFQQVNDKIDVFNIKQSEFSSSTANYDNLGDMTGLSFQLGYSFFNKLYLHGKYNKQNLKYASSTLKNTDIDIYLRYQLYANENFALSLDGGYETNTAKDLYIYNLSTINNMLSKALPDQKASIDSNNNLNYIDSNGVSSTKILALTPYMALKDTSDDTKYFRAIMSYKSPKNIFDVFVGYKQINIRNFIDSSIAHEADPNIDASQAYFKSSREDALIFAGFNELYPFSDFFAMQMKYEYNYIERIDSLKYKQINNIFDLNFIFSITRNSKLYIGGKIMSNQFNGQIPYLYSKYTQTSFDHKYGWANLGLIFTF